MLISELPLKYIYIYIYKRKEGRKIKQKGDPEEVDEPYKC